MNERIWCRSLAGLLTAYCFTAFGCSPLPPAKAPPAKPVVVKHELETNFLSNNQMIVWLRNDGDAGKVLVQVWGYRVSSHSERGESGVGKLVRESLSTREEPPPQTVRDYKLNNIWEKELHMENGEKTRITVDLPDYSSWGSVEIKSVTACGLSGQE